MLLGFGAIAALLALGVRFARNVAIYHESVYDADARSALASSFATKSLDVQTVATENQLSVGYAQFLLAVGPSDVQQKEGVVRIDFTSSSLLLMRPCNENPGILTTVQRTAVSVAFGATASEPLDYDTVRSILATSGLSESIDGKTGVVPAFRWYEWCYSRQPLNYLDIILMSERSIRLYTVFADTKIRNRFARLGVIAYEAVHTHGLVLCGETTPTGHVTAAILVWDKTTGISQGMYYSYNEGDGSTSDMWPILTTFRYQVSKIPGEGELNSMIQASVGEWRDGGLNHDK